MKDCKSYPARKTLGAEGLEPYRVLGKSIRRDIEEARMSIEELSERSKWDWQTIRRIMVGERRTDFVELIIIAVLISKNQSEMEELILTWVREVFKCINQGNPPRWR